MPCPALPALPAERDLGEFADSFTGSVEAHNVLALRITPLEGPADDGWRPWHGQPAYAALAANVAVQRYEDWVPKSAPWRYMKVGAAVWAGDAHRRAWLASE